MHFHEIFRNLIDIYYLTNIHFSVRGNIYQKSHLENVRIDAHSAEKQCSRPFFKKNYLSTKLQFKFCFSLVKSKSFFIQILSFIYIHSSIWVTLYNKWKYTHNIESVHCSLAMATKSKYLSNTLASVFKFGWSMNKHWKNGGCPSHFFFSEVTL